MDKDPKTIHAEIEAVKKEMNKIDAKASQMKRQAKTEKMYGKIKISEDLQKEVSHLQNDKMNLLSKRKHLENDEKKALKEQAKKQAK